MEWGAGLPDLDNDGLQDLFYVTGNVYPEIERALPQYPHRGPRLVFRNTGAAGFVNVTNQSGDASVPAFEPRRRLWRSRQ